MGVGEDIGISRRDIRPRLEDGLLPKETFSKINGVDASIADRLKTG